MNRLFFTCVSILIFLSVTVTECARRASSLKPINRYNQIQSPSYVTHVQGQPLRILFVVENFPLAEQPFILDQIAGAIDRGHEVYIAAKYEVHDEIVPTVVRSHRLMERTLFFGSANPYLLLQNDPEIPHINTFDAICCQFGNIGADMMRFMPDAPDVSAKLITCWRGAAKEAAIEPRVRRALFRRGDLFLPVCEFLKNDLIILGCDARKIQVVHAGIDYPSYVCDRAANKSGSINLMSICRLVEKKGIEYAIRAVAEIVKHYPRVHYTIVGDGPMKKDLQALVMNLGMQEHITFVGNQSHEEIPHLLCSVDIFLSPSVTTADGNREGIANSLKEAMASGALVVATDHSGTSELVVDGITGFLVPERDVAALAKVICSCIAHPECIDDIRIAARQRVWKQFNLSKTIDQFIAIIEEVCLR